MDLAAVGEVNAHLGVARHRAGGQAPDALAAAVDADVARHRLGMHLAVQASAQADVAADRLGLGVGRVQGQVEVAADAANVGLAGRGGDGNVAADAFDVQVARGHAVDVDVGRNRLGVQVRVQRDLPDQRGRPGGVAAPAAHPSRIFDADSQVLAVAVDHQLLDAVAEGAGDAHLVAVPGAHLDAALDV